MLCTIALLFTMLLVACSNQQTNALSYSEVPLNRAPKEITSYIKDLTLQASGMHQIIKNSTIFYLYLDPSFLNDGI
ncbi:hypothetical protein Pryu01_01946 [Paraliobacillus ryukyuensis]|uniref:Uncharacterized protein n=1 Tax=Paraliobacillus ryukyuensis TaxID=200904 RepID=A0A366DYP8_9BACI|nr:hypothetical protein [Paraliobacillus ryukyuensis]RBO95213.1 hypothetical protein DES48_10950 [Paraliobacillus ryukyuensis]